MKRILYALLSLCIVSMTATSCDHSGDGYARIYLDSSGLYFEEYGATDYITFTTENLVDLYVSTVPDGWSAEINLSAGTLTVTSPSETDSDIDLTGTVYVVGTHDDETTTSATLYVGIVDFIDLDDARANSMIVSQTNTYYTFMPIIGEDESAVVYADSYEITWKTLGNPISSVRQYPNGRVGFYVSEDSNDIDDDDDEEDLINGNAVISALNEDEEVIWSWHIWVTDQDIAAVNIGGVEFMNTNLGSYCNYFAEEEDIRDSYGLYYQWGRKDPFISPYYYDAAGSTGRSIYDDDSYGTSITFEATNDDYDDDDGAVGELAYSILYPLTFITGKQISSYDWLYATQHDGTLWSGTTKSKYDPSPKGWRVPSADELAALGSVATTSDPEDYSVTIGGELFIAGGLRTYIDGSIQNISGDGSYAPWAGYYWSSTSVEPGFKSVAYNFYLNTADDTVVVNKALPSYRANGMQIRPVRD